MASTKARLLNHDFPVHGICNLFLRRQQNLRTYQNCILVESALIVRGVEQRGVVPNWNRFQTQRKRALIRIETGLDTYQNALSLQSNIEKPGARAPTALLRLTRVHERMFRATPCAVTPLSIILKNFPRKTKKLFLTCLPSSARAKPLQDASPILMQVQFSWLPSRHLWNKMWLQRLNIQLTCSMVTCWCRYRNWWKWEGKDKDDLELGRIFRQISTLLENSSLIFWHHEMLHLPRFGLLPARKMAAGKSALPSGMLLDFVLRDHNFLET